MLFIGVKVIIQPLGLIKVTAKKIARIVCNGLLAQSTKKWHMLTNYDKMSELQGKRGPCAEGRE